jgi:hypothetical protein
MFGSIEGWSIGSIVLLKIPLLSSPQYRFGCVTLIRQCSNSLLHENKETNAGDYD